MNVNALLDFQKELLKPFAPSQEFALLTLVSEENVDEETVIDYATAISDKYPHVSALYNSYAVMRPDNALPLIVPVENSDEVFAELFVTAHGNLTVSNSLRTVMQNTLNKIPEYIPTLDELDAGTIFVDELTVDLLVDNILQGIIIGTRPVVNNIKEKHRESRKIKLLDSVSLVRRFLPVVA